MLEQGERVDRYIVERHLGEGGMARVYLVRHAELGTRHALKVLTLRSPDLDERFLQEGRVQARLRHPNIVAVTDVLQLDRGPALVMDWVAGPSLDKLLDPDGLPIDDAIAIFRSLVHAVGHAHIHGTIHRDLKPENVLVEIRRNGIVPRITDFGLARALDQPEDERRTRTGMTMGTPVYMSPEQMKDASRCDERTDIYALGVLLYELVSGRAPYLGRDIVSIAVAQRDGPHLPLSRVRPEVPQWLSDLADHMLRHHPSERAHSCLEVLERLERRKVVLADLSEGAPPITGELARNARFLWTDPGVSAPSVAASPPPFHPSPPARGSMTSVASVSETLVPEVREVTWKPMVGIAAVVGLLLLLGASSAALVVWATIDAPVAPAALEVASPGPTVGTATPVAPEPVAAEPPAPPDAPPEPATEPSPKVTAAPAPPPPTATPRQEPAAAPAAIRFQAVGDADTVWLHRGGRDYRPGDPLEPGTYTIRAIFGGSAPTDAGSLTVVSGDQPVVSCVAGFQRCGRK